MSVQKCGVCHTGDSKYKCPVCELRYCSITCYKSHKTTHSEEDATASQQHQETQVKRDRPGTTQRVPKVDFTGFEDDAEFKRLLKRYPLLKAQLQVIYGLTLEPGPDDKWTWNKQPLLPPPFSGAPRRIFRGGAGRGRGMRGARGMRGGRGRGGYDRDGGREAFEERQHGLWTHEKGDKEALLAMKKMKTTGVGREDDERVEGMREFVELCQIKFGSGREHKSRPAEEQ